MQRVTKVGRVGVNKITLRLRCTRGYICLELALGSHTLKGGMVLAPPTNKTEQEQTELRRDLVHGLHQRLGDCNMCIFYTRVDVRKARTHGCHGKVKLLYHK